MPPGNAPLPLANAPRAHSPRPPLLGTGCDARRLGQARPLHEVSVLRMVRSTVVIANIEMSEVDGFSLSAVRAIPAMRDDRPMIG